MAENEWYDKYKKEVTAALAKGKAAPRDDAIPCALVKASDGTFLILAHGTAAKQTAIVQTAKSKGARVVSSGVLFLGDGGPTFEVAVGDASVQAKFSNAAAEATGKPMKFHVVPAPGPRGGGPAPEEPPAVTPEAFTDRAQAAALALRGAAPKTQEVLKPRLAQALTLAKEGKLPEASAALALVEKALAALAAPAPPTAPPPPTQPTAPASPPDKAQFMQRLQEVKGRYADALKANPPNRAALEKAMGMVVAAARENDFARGLKVLDALDRALAAPPPSPGSRVAPETPPPPEAPPESTTVSEEKPPSPSPPPEHGPQVPAAKTWKTWDAALNEARDRLGRLTKKLAELDDEEAAEIARANLGRVVNDLDGGLMKALGDFDDAGEDDRESAAKKAAELLGRQRELLLKDVLVEELDANPFGVTVDLRKTLGLALKGVEGKLKA